MQAGEVDAPLGKGFRVTEDFSKCNGDDDAVEGQVGGDKDSGDADRFFKAFQEDAAEHGKDQQGDDDLVIHPVRRDGVADEVCGTVRGRQCHGDDEVGGGEAEQDEDEELAAPGGKDFLQHGDAALAVGALLADAFVDGQRGEQGDQDENEGGQRAEHAGGKEGDARLVAECGEVIHAGKAHDTPPGALRFRLVFGVFCAGDLQVRQ